MSTPEPSGEFGRIQVPVVWVGAEELPVQFANAFLGLVAPNEIFLTLGSILPPLISGETVEEREASARSVSYVQAKPIVRLAFTPERFDEMVKVLQETQANYAKLMEAHREERGK